MPTAQEYIGFAEQCEQLAKRLPEHSDALLEIAAAWRQLAGEKAKTQINGEEAASHPKAK